MGPSIRLTPPIRVSLNLETDKFYFKFYLVVREKDENCPHDDVDPEDHGKVCEVNEQSTTKYHMRRLGNAFKCTN